jgi:hypothetical protein
MKIEELMEKADKGPFKFYERKHFSEIQIPFSDGSWLDNGHNHSIAMCHGPDKGKFNAALILHCLQSFGPMLEALEEAERELERLREYVMVDSFNSALHNTSKAIESASTVEVPK